MKKIITSLALIQVSLILFGQIVADHRAVDRYDDIPQQYIDKVKKMLVFVGGESHASGYRHGLDILEQYDSKFQVLTYTTEPPPSHSVLYLRFGQLFNLGEQIYTSSSYRATLKSVIKSYNDSGNPFDVAGFGWCYDMTWVNPPGGTEDPVYKVRWAGTSEGGPDGDMRWGLDSDDEALTGNSVCMDTYLNAIIDYNQYFVNQNIPTTMVFTTGPVDGYSGTENGFQREIKHNYIRSFVAENSNRILFDYADILCWNNDGEKYVVNWNDDGTIRPHAQIHPDNQKNYDNSWHIIASNDDDGDHIGEVGALRLAKAMWWLLARMAGWDDELSSAVNDADDTIVDEPKVSFDSRQLIIDSPDLYMNGQIEIFNSLGSLVETKHISNDINYFDTGRLSSGLYFVVLSKDNNRVVSKVALSR